MSYTMDEIQARAQRQLDRMRDLSDRMAGLRVSETSPDGAVTVTVDGNGALCDLRLSAAIARMSPQEFERIVVQTAGQAAAAAFAQRGELVTEFNEESSP
ncbi:YbaB/EbfC family nucleoid-associated protein [Nocardia transvalensis]|uniref:YbaB/EbfC family nucleoid-associated protein n=1 Tax=Nocardia transvalensis TaxID=37333 RepID=UPI0018950AB6|nr:YbaB/EbfC family nucleoid-associated protein [Nocardia transvalensis]MBF6327526.1 YbaB/EbfC family nucleoid-associated protein [Nocardia transvalensis]